MVKQFHDNQWFITGGLLILSLVIWLALMREFRLDDSFITYRYARNVTRGWGLVYNQGEYVLSTTAPLYALLLAVLSLIIPDFHLLGGLVGALSIGIGAALLVDVLPEEIPLAIRAWGGLLYVLATPLWLALGMETPLWIMLVLAALGLAMRSRWGLAGLLVGLAVLTRPDAALPGALLGLAAIGAALNALGTRRRWWLPLVLYILAAGIPVLVFALLAWVVYGSPFPATLSAKGAQASLGITGFGLFVDAWGGLRMIVESLVAQSPLYLIAAPLMLLGLSRRLSLSSLLLVAWGALHLLAYMVLGVAPYRWYYVPLLPGTIVLLVYGLWRFSQLAAHRLNTPLGSRAAVVGVAVLPMIASGTSFAQIAAYFQQGGPRETMLPIVDWQAYQQAGEWLNANAPKDALIGVSEVGQLGFYADRRMTDYLGLLQPDVAALLKRDDLYSWLVGYAPDYLVFQRFGGKVGLALYNYFIEYDPWFVASYHEVAKFDDPRYVLGPVVIYQRTTPERAMLTQPVEGDFGALQLTGVALEEGGASTQGGALRARLDWRIFDPLPADAHITLTVLGAPQETKFDSDYHTRDWRDTVSIWNTLMLPKGMVPGRYPLEVTVGFVNGSVKPAKAGWIDIPPP